VSFLNAVCFTFYHLVDNLNEIFSTNVYEKYFYAINLIGDKILRYIIKSFSIEMSVKIIAVPPAVQNVELKTVIKILCKLYHCRKKLLHYIRQLTLLYTYNKPREKMHIT
jgi:hypothetical protein